MNKQNRNLNIDWISFYRSILIKTSSETYSTFTQCVPKGWLQSLGKTFGMSSMRVYLYNDKSNSYIIRHVWGDKKTWKNVTVPKSRKDKSHFEGFYFVKIRYIRENVELTLGYLAFRTEVKITKKILKSLDVLCMLYGNYIINRLMSGQTSRINTIIPKLFSIAAGEKLPGSKISDILYYLTGQWFNNGLYCTIYNNIVVGECLKTHKGARLLNDSPWCRIDSNFIENLKNNSHNHRCDLSDLPKEFIDYLLKSDNRSPETFSVQLYPVFGEEDLVGLWMFLRSKNNPYADFDISNILEGIQPLLNNSYKYLFQRRFKTMIINPMFQNRDTRVDNKSVFVIMPFEEAWSDVIWSDVLTPAIKEIGMNPIRADDLFGPNIMEDVWKGILQAAILICDITGRNPNVFYELGIAHTLGKKVILLTQNADDIPFDLRHLRHIIYGTSLKDGLKLKNDVKVYITQAIFNGENEITTDSNSIT